MRLFIKINELLKTHTSFRDAVTNTIQLYAILFIRYVIHTPCYSYAVLFIRHVIHTERRPSELKSMEDSDGVTFLLFCSLFFNAFEPFDCGYAAAHLYPQQIDPRTYSFQT